MGFLFRAPANFHVPVDLTPIRCESSAGRKLSREERAVIDVYETVALLEGEDCLHGFWQSGVNHQRVVNSFELIGVTGKIR